MWLCCRESSIDPLSYHLYIFARWCCFKSVQPYNTQIHVLIHLLLCKRTVYCTRTEARSLFPSQHSSWRFWWFGRSRRLCSNSRHKAPQRTTGSKDKVWLMIMLITNTQQTKVSVSGVRQWCLDIFDYIWILMFAPEVVADIRKSFDLFVFSSTVELIQFCVRSAIVRWCFQNMWHASDSWGF